MLDEIVKKDLIMYASALQNDDIVNKSELNIVIDGHYFSCLAFMSIIEVIQPEVIVQCFPDISDFIAWYDIKKGVIGSVFINMNNTNNMVEGGMLVFLNDGWKILGVKQHKIILIMDKWPIFFANFSFSDSVKFLFVRRSRIDEIREEFARTLLETSQSEDAIVTAKPKYHSDYSFIERGKRLTRCEIRAVKSILNDVEIHIDAKRLGLSEKTIYAQRSNAMKKLGFDNFRDVIFHKDIIRTLCAKGLYHRFPT